MSIPRPDINEESELDHRITVRALGAIGFAQAWSDDEVVDRNLAERYRVPKSVTYFDYRLRGSYPETHTGTYMEVWEFRLWELYGLGQRYWAYRLVH